MSIPTNLNEFSVKESEYHNFETPRVFPKRRSSIFALDLKELSQGDNQSSFPRSLENYSQKLKNEILEWKRLIKQKNDEIKLLFDQKKIVNESVLNDSQLDFLRGSIDIVKFADDSRDFQSKSIDYLLRKEMFLMRKEYYMEQLEDKFTSKVMSLANIHINKSES